MKKCFLLLSFLCITMVMKAELSKTIKDVKPGELIYKMTASEFNNVTNLTLTGSIDARDFKSMHLSMPNLLVVDLKDVTIVEYTGIGPDLSKPDTYPANTIPHHSFVNQRSLSSIILPASTTAIGARAFASAPNLNSVTLPNTLTTIGKEAFYFCLSLSSITIPSSVTKIEADAFNFCKMMTSLSIPASVISIGNTAFSQSFASINVDPANPSYSSLDGVLYNKDKTTLIYCPRNTSGSFITPASVKTIKNDAFYLCANLTSVEIPSPLDTIGVSAFNKCSNLTTVKLPNTVRYIGSFAFLNCSKLSTIDLPATLNYIGMRAFSDCTSLTTVVLSDLITSMEDYVFADCTNLTSVTLPKSLTSIGKGAFMECKALQTVVIPDLVTKICDAAYYNCTGLTSVVIPASVTSMGEGIFQNCALLSSIYAYPVKPLFLYSSVFSGINKNTCDLFVPSTSLNLYKAAYGWQDFTKMNAIVTSAGKEINNRLVAVSPNPAKDFLTIKAEDGVVSIFNCNGKLEMTQNLTNNKTINISSLHSGVYVVVVNKESFKIVKE